MAIGLVVNYQYTTLQGDIRSYIRAASTAIEARELVSALFRRYKFFQELFSSGESPRTAKMKVQCIAQRAMDPMKFPVLRFAAWGFLAHHTLHPPAGDTVLSHAVLGPFHPRRLCLLAAYATMHRSGQPSFLAESVQSTLTLAHGVRSGGHCELDRSFDELRYLGVFRRDGARYSPGANYTIALSRALTYAHCLVILPGDILDIDISADRIRD